MQGPDTDAQDQPLHFSNSACNARPVHTDGSDPEILAAKRPFPRMGKIYSASNRQGNRKTLSDEARVGRFFPNYTQPSGHRGWLLTDYQVKRQSRSFLSTARF